MLEEHVGKHKYDDSGKGVELHLNISHQKLRDARRLLESEGYKTQYVKVEQLGTGKFTTYKVLTAPGTSWKETNEAIQRGEL
ncbi:hypothetical protein CTU88_46530, partial [Streptomyces sp. JV178]